MRHHDHCVGFAILVLATLCAVLAAGCGTPLQRSTQAAFAGKQAAENTYISIRRGTWALQAQGVMVEPEAIAIRQQARELIEGYYAAQNAWYLALAHARDEGDTELSAPGRVAAINTAAAKVAAANVKLRLLYEKHIRQEDSP